MEEINKIIGKNLLTLRKNKKLTQMELAEKFNYSDKTISKWENGESLPSIDVLYQLACFYETTLNDLTSNEDILSTTGKKKHKEKVQTPRMFPPRFMVTLLSISAVWALATALFVIFKICLDINYYMCFMWAWPLSFVLAIIFNSIWGRFRNLFPLLSVLLWSLLTSIYLQLLLVHINIWPIFILGIPLQISILLWAALVKKPKGYYKKLKEEQNKEKESN